MAHIIMKLEAEPILLVRVHGVVTAQEHFKLSLDVANLIETIPGRIYRINDLTGTCPRLVDMVEIVNQITRGWSGTASDPRIVTLVIMDNVNVFLGLRYLRRKWGKMESIHLFATVADALAYARAQIAAQAVDKVRIMA